MQISGPTPDATTTRKGKLMLTNDLSGTADAPTVPAILANRINNFIMLTHSYGGGTTYADSGAPNVYQQSFVAHLQGLVGAHEQNSTQLMQSGARLSMTTNAILGSAYSGWTAVAQHVLPASQRTINSSGDVIPTESPTAGVGCGVIVHGVNDYLIDYSSTASILAAQPAHAQRAYKHALRASISRMRAGYVASSYWNGSANAWESPITFSGTWADVADVTSNTGPVYKRTGTNTDYVQFTFPTNVSENFTLALAFRGQASTLSSISEDLDNSETGVDVASRSNFPQSGNFTIIIDSEQMLVTAGHGTGAGTFTVVRNYNGTSAATHTTGAAVTVAQNGTVTYTTDGSNANITGTTTVGGQGNGGSTVWVVKRFACTSADAGKYVRATISGIPTASGGDANLKLDFDSAWIESVTPPPVVVSNIHHWEYGVSIFSTVSLLAGFNTAITDVIAEFTDGYVKLADMHTTFYNRNGILDDGDTGTGGNQSMNNTDVTSNVRITFNSSSFVPKVGMQFTFGKFGGERVVCTAVTLVSGNTYNMSLTRGYDSTTKATHAVGDWIGPMDWMSTDLVHPNPNGHSVYAQVLYDAFKSMLTTTAPSTYQLATHSANWSQYSQTFSMGIIDNWYKYPNHQTTGAGVVTLDSMNAHPIYIPKIVTVTRLAAAATVQGGGAGTLRLGIYWPDATHSRPGRLLIEYGSVATNYGAGANNDLGVDGHIILRPGWYWLAACQQTFGATLRTLGASGLTWPDIQTDTVLTTNSVNGFRQTGVTGALPSSWSSWSANTGVTASGIPRIHIKLRSGQFA